MRRPARLCLLAIAGALLVSGCALRDPRDSYAYGRADGLWDADYDLLLDWNYPTSSNQGRLEAPKRFRPERPAIGVPWATGNPSTPGPEHNLAPSLEAAAAAAPAHEGDDDGDARETVVTQARDDRSDAAVRFVVRGERTSR
jgi:hypothetical protein